MADKETLLEYLKKKAEELRKELEIIEEIIRIVESSSLEQEEPIIVKEKNSTRITFPHPLDPNSIEAEYLISRLNEIVGDDYELLRERNGRIRGIRISRFMDDRVIKEIKSIIKIVSENIGSKQLR